MILCFFLLITYFAYTNEQNITFIVVVIVLNVCKCYNHNISFLIYLLKAIQSVYECLHWEVLQV